MKEQCADLWSPAFDAPGIWRGITTNGYVKKDGNCVMGRGVAAQAAARYPGLPAELGRRIRIDGNHMYDFAAWRLFTFPVKHTWELPADLDLIARSVAALTKWASTDRQLQFILPRPGCGNGRLTWEQVRPICEGLPDNVTIVERI